MRGSEGTLSRTIENFDKRSSAEKQGLRINDVVMSVDGKNVLSLKDMLNILKDKKPGDTVKVKVDRAGKEYAYDVKLITRPVDSRYKSVRGYVQSRNGGGIIEGTWGRYWSDDTLPCEWQPAKPLDGAFDSEYEEFEYTVPEILKEGNYVIEIKSLNEAGEKDAVYSSARFTIDNGPPAAPKNLTGRREFAYVTLYWDGNAEGDLAGYNLYRKDSGEYKLLATLSESSLFYMDLAVKKHKRYSYKLKAFDNMNSESGYSNSCSFEAYEPVKKTSPPRR